MFEFRNRMVPVFKDEQRQAQFERDGYTVVQFYTEAEMAELNKLYNDLHPADEQGFYPSTFSKDKNYRQKADEEIRRIGNRTIEDTLLNSSSISPQLLIIDISNCVSSCMELQKSTSVLPQLI